VAEIIAVERDIEFAVVQVLGTYDAAQLIPEAPCQHHSAGLEANERHTRQVPMVLDQLVAQPLNREPEGLARE
jgi:hypothetical protein